MKRRIRRIRRALKRAGLYNVFHITLIAVLLTGFCVILFNVKEPEQQEKEPEEIQAEVMQNPETMTQTAENIEDKYKVFDTMSEDWGSDDLEGFVFYDLPEQYADKTAAGIRTAPISEKVYPFFEYWYNLNDCEYLLSTPEGEHFKYRNYYDSYWSPLIETLGMKHRPHDTRHTCISMLTVAGVSDKVIKKIVGHKGQGVTEVVYTHFEIEELIDAINKI